MALDVHLPSNFEILSKDFDKLLSREEKIAFNQGMKGRFPGKLESLDDESFPGMVKALYKFGAIDEDDSSLLSCIAEKSSNKEQIKSVIDKCKSAEERQIIGRKEDVKQVRDKLENRHMVVPGVNLFGVSGVGKTTLAQEISKTFKGLHMITLNLRGIAEIKTVYFLILEAFNLKAWDYDKERLIVLLDNLNEKTFVIIDNVEQFLSKDDESPRNEFIALLENVFRSKACKDGKLKLLLTSREEISESLLKGQFFSEHKVHPFTEEVSKGFISRRGKRSFDISEGSQDSQDEALSKIAELCRDIPYLLQGAEQMMREYFSTPVEVLRKIESQIEKGVPKEYACIGALFESISNDHLKELAVKMSLLQRPFSASTAMQIAGISSDMDAVIDLEILASHKILEREKDEKDRVKYDIHSLFQDFVQDCLRETHPSYKDAYLQGEQQFFVHFSGKFTKLAELLETDFVKTFSKLERNRANFELTIDISKSRSEAFEILLHSDEHNEAALIGILFEVLKDCQERKKLYDEWAGLAEQARKWLTSAHLRCWQALQGPDIDGTWEVLQIAEESLKKAEQTATPDQLKAGRSLFLHCRARTMWLQASMMNIAEKKKEDKERRSLLKESIKDLNEALEMRQKFMTHHTLNARTLNLIGNCYMELDDPNKAEGFYKRAINMKLKLVGSEKHWEIPTYYNQMGEVHNRHGMRLEKGLLRAFHKPKVKEEYIKAVEWMEKALSLQEELGVADTEHTATFQRNLANVLIGLGEFDQALTYATKCYVNRLKRLGKHPETVRILFLIGVIHEWKEDKMAALKSYEEAFIMEESLPPGNHSVARVRICERFKTLMCEKCKDKLQNYEKRISILEVNQITQSSTAIEDTRSRPQDETAQEVNSVPEICSEMIKVSVDAYGGTYNLPSHGLFLNFPPGAIDKPTEITVQSLTKNSLPSPAGDMEAVVSFIVELGPCDIVLQKPVVAEVLHSGCVGRGHYENKAMAFNKSTKIWEEIQGQYALHLPPNCLETECIQVQLSMLTTLAVISRLITNSFEVPVSGCYVVSSVCQDISLDFPKDAVDKTIEGSMKVLPMPNAIPTNIIAHPSPIVVINGFENVKFNKPATLTLPHPCPTKYPAGKVRLYIKDDEWNEMTDSICYQEHKLTIELQIIHFSSIWIFVGDDDSDINVRQLHQQLTGVPQEVCFVSFMSELESEDTSTNDIKLNICCMANHMIDSMVQRMKETFGEDFKHLAQATGKEMLPKQTVCTKVEGGNFESREEVELQFSGDTICGKELVITKKRGEEETPWFFIRFLTKNPDKTVSNNPLAQLTIDECRLDKKRSSDVPPSTADPGLENVYSMNSSPRGVLIIIENERFNSKVPPLDERTGSEKDVQALSNVFCRCLDFKMRYIRNQVIFDILRNLRKFLEETKNYDCCIVCVMSHGIDKKFYDIDGKEVKVLQIQYIVKDVFVGKPKLIFIQACRTKDTKATNCPKEDDTHNPASPVSAEEKTTEDLSLPQGFSKSNSNKVPEASQACSDEIKEAKEADILTAYSCCQGYGSWRYPEQGSLFIQTLAKTFEEKAHCMDVLSMLTEVINDVVEQCQKSEILRCDIQVCEVTTRLRKKLYLKQNNLTLSIPE